MLTRLLAVAALGVGLTLAPTAAHATPPEGAVCDPLDTGKIDTTGDPLEVTVTAPDGMLVAGYCVKAGSAVQDEGPEYVTLDPPAPTVTFGHSTGRAVSHYSATFVEAPAEIPPAPADEVRTVETSRVVTCETVTVTTRQETRAYAWDADALEWVPGAWQTTGEASSTAPATPADVEAAGISCGDTTPPVVDEPETPTDTPDVEAPPVVVEAPAEPRPTTAAPMLAETGPADLPLAVLTAAGLIALGATTVRVARARA